MVTAVKIRRLWSSMYSRAIFTSTGPLFASKFDLAAHFPDVVAPTGTCRRSPGAELMPTAVRPFVRFTGWFHNVKVIPTISSNVGGACSRLDRDADTEPIVGDRCTHNILPRALLWLCRISLRASHGAHSHTHTPLSGSKAPRPRPLPDQHRAQHTHTHAPALHRSSNSLSVLHQGAHLIRVHDQAVSSRRRDRRRLRGDRHWAEVLYYTSNES